MSVAAYPNAPTAKRRDTAFEAARKIAPREKTIRDRVLEALKVQAGTPEQIAARIGEPVMNVRPRCSQLSELGLVHDSGRRGDAMGGRKAIIWAVVQ